ncbi:MAG: REP-associated tyrosine transposase [Pyrinomonadaceae bacterium]|jgi:putative DNA methylase
MKKGHVGWHSRGYLPHFDVGERAQFVTFRLGDSLPQVVLERWRRELAHCHARETEVTLRRRIEAYLDQGYGSAWLRDARAAGMIEQSLLNFDSERYRLSAWVVMPNHVHLLATPSNNHTLSGIIHSLKSYTAQEANKLLGRKGQFWQEDYFDRYIRNAEHFARATAYIENNPVKACLCETARDWPFSSARLRLAARDAGSANSGSAGIPAR